MENAQDMIAHGRSLRGERNPNAKLTAEDVNTIRQAKHAHGLIARLAQAYGVSSSEISAIRSGDRWGPSTTPCKRRPPWVLGRHTVWNGKARQQARKIRISYWHIGGPVP
jgi:hypothetical protein